MKGSEVEGNEIIFHKLSQPSRTPGVMRTHLLLLTSPYAYFPNLIRTHFFLTVMDSCTREEDQVSMLRTLGMLCCGKSAEYITWKYSGKIIHLQRWAILVRIYSTSGLTWLNPG